MVSGASLIESIIQFAFHPTMVAAFSSNSNGTASLPNGLTKTIGISYCSLAANNSSKSSLLSL